MWVFVRPCADGESLAPSVQVLQSHGIDIMGLLHLYLGTVHQGALLLWTGCVIALGSIAGVSYKEKAE